MQAGDYRYGGRGHQHAPDPYSRDDPYGHQTSDLYSAVTKDRSVDRRYRDDPYSRDSLGIGDELKDTSPRLTRNSFSGNKLDPHGNYGNGYPPAGRIDDHYDRGRASDPGGIGGGPVAVYELDHLATFTVSPKQGMSKPMDGVKRLREMEGTTGIWTMRIQLRINRREIVIIEKATQKEIESFPVSRVSNPSYITDNTSDDIYNNIVLFTVQGDTSRQPAEMHLFQCVRKLQGQDVTDDIEAAVSGRFPRRPPAVKEKPNIRTHSPSVSRHSSDGDPSLKSSFEDLSRRPLFDNRLLYATRDDFSRKPKEHDTTDDVSLLNHCFDDIESFVASLQQAANAQKELERRRTMNRGGPDPAEDMLRMRSSPPPLKQFIETLQKFKLAFNLLPKLRTVLKDPDAIQLLHMLFAPLALVVDASRDEQGKPAIASTVKSPLLTAEACLMFDNELNTKESNLWKSLGPAWTTPSNRWNGTVPFYYPSFSDGWRYRGINMEDIGLALPAAGYGDTIPGTNAMHRNNGVPTNTNPYGQQQMPVTNPGPSPYVQVLPPLQQQPAAPHNVNPQPQQHQQPVQQPATPSQPAPLQPAAPTQVIPAAAAPAVAPIVPAAAAAPVAAAAPPAAPAAAGRNSAVDPSQQQFLNELQARRARIYKAMVDREAKNQKELTVKTGDILEIVDSSKNWWKAKNNMGGMGFVPNTILKEYIQ